MADDDARRPAPAQLERAHDRLAEPQRYRDQVAACENAGAPGGTVDRADDADPRRDEHVVPQLLRAVHDAGLVRRDEPARCPSASRSCATPTCASGWTSGRARPRPACSRGSPSWGRYLIGDTFSAANEGLKGRSSPTSPSASNARHVRHAGRHRDRRRPAHGPLAAAVRRRRGSRGRCAPRRGTTRS